MKILDLHTYDEKLKIKPVNVNDLSSTSYFKRSDLSTFDIVKINNSLYMVFVGEDALGYAYSDEIAMRLKGIYARQIEKLGLFIRVNDTLRFSWIGMEHYNEQLVRDPKNSGFSGDSSWNVSEIYVHDKSYANEIADTNPLKNADQYVLENLIKKYNYIQIER